MKTGNPTKLMMSFGVASALLWRLSDNSHSVEENVIRETAQDSNTAIHSLFTKRVAMAPSNPFQVVVHDVSREINLASSNKKITKTSTNAGDTAGDEQQVNSPGIATLREKTSPISRLQDVPFIDDDLIILAELIDKAADVESEHWRTADFSEIESRIFEQIEMHPKLIQMLVRFYPELVEGGSKKQIRSILVSVGDDSIENFAAKRLVRSELGAKEQWAALLGDVGAGSIDSSNIVFETILFSDNIDLVRSGLQSLRSNSITYEEREVIVGQLQYFVNHWSPSVRSAGVEAMSKFVKVTDSYFLESAITDSSTDVQLAAILASYHTGIKSEQLRLSLMNILVDSSLPANLRLEASTALRQYSLGSDENKIINEFQDSIIIPGTDAHG